LHSENIGLLLLVPAVALASTVIYALLFIGTRERTSHQAHLQSPS
jgi:hypothetical protein